MEIFSSKTFRPKRSLIKSTHGGLQGGTPTYGRNGVRGRVEVRVGVAVAVVHVLVLADEDGVVLAGRLRRVVGVARLRRLPPPGVDLMNQF
jgi:hypothetical protein